VILHRHARQGLPNRQQFCKSPSLLSTRVWARPPPQPPPPRLAACSFFTRCDRRPAPVRFPDAAAGRDWPQMDSDGRETPPVHDSMHPGASELLPTRVAVVSDARPNVSVRQTSDACEARNDVEDSDSLSPVRHGKFLP
jgi:hypothetical protein